MKILVPIEGVVEMLFCTKCVLSGHMGQTWLQIVRD